MHYLKTIVLLATLSLSQHTLAQKIYSTDEGAIRGYDPVAFFTAHKPVKGSTTITTEWSGATWHFASEANKKAFIASPEKFAPQYGGFCAYGASENHKSPTEPGTFTILNDKLYLNYNEEVKHLWAPQKEVLIKKADVNWKTLKDE